MDTTGESNLASLVKHFEKFGGLGPNIFFGHTGEALNFALSQLDLNKCLDCKQFAFRECTSLSNKGPQQEVAKNLKPDPART